MGDEETAPALRISNLIARPLLRSPQPEDEEEGWWWGGEEEKEEEEEAEEEEEGTGRANADLDLQSCCLARNR